MSIESGPSPEDMGTRQEVTKSETEKALHQERSVLERFKGKAKQVAGVLLFVSVLSAGPGMVGEAYAQEKVSPTKVEQVEERKVAKEFTCKQFKGETRETASDFKMEFIESDTEAVLKEQNILFDKEKCTFELINEKKISVTAESGPIIKFFEINGVRTDRVEVSIDKLNIPIQGKSDSTKKIIKIKSFNSDSSVDVVTITDGRITGMTTEKPQK